MAKRETFKQNTIAIVYDFDGTLTPQSMQEYTILPELGISDPKKEFWDIAAKVARDEAGDPMLTYLRLLKEKIDAEGQHWTPKGLKRLGEKIEYFPGVESWFDLINGYVRDRGEGSIKLKHYVISAGQREILEGCKFKGKFSRMYASEYHYNNHNAPDFPKVVVNDTNKTQFLFRINKGKEELHEPINDHMPQSQRPIPFSNILYIGDGLTDVPCMTVTKQSGGHSLAVYRSKNRKGLQICRTLFSAGRIDCFAEPDYSENTTLDRSIKTILDIKIARIRLEKSRFTLTRTIDRANKNDQANEVIKE